MNWLATWVSVSRFSAPQECKLHRAGPFCLVHSQPQGLAQTWPGRDAPWVTWVTAEWGRRGTGCQQTASLRPPLPEARLSLASALLLTPTLGASPLHRPATSTHRELLPSHPFRLPTLPPHFRGPWTHQGCAPHQGLSKCRPRFLKCSSTSVPR